MVCATRCSTLLAKCELSFWSDILTLYLITAKQENPCVVVASVDRSVKFNCRNPNGTVHWTVPRNRHYGNIRIGDNILLIDKVQEKNGGRYECLVYNEDEDDFAFWSNKMKKYIDKDRVLFRARCTLRVLGKSTVLILYSNNLKLWSHDLKF